MISRIDWRSATSVVVVMVVVGLIIATLLNFVTSTIFAAYAQENSATSAAGFMLAINSVVACLQGLVYGGVIGAAYVWLASRRVLLDTSEAIGGAGMTAVIYLVVATIVGLCWTTISLTLAYQSRSVSLGVEDLGTLAFSILSGVVLHSVIQGITLLIGSVPTALLVSRSLRRA